ncbi:glycosyl hydrolase 108 family protein [Mesorhizobium sp.]|uniref:glycosyl hydrolase 108 family protein n=1 Tax=Mesorhizobium sp. TaxID=1871066 RepID=UPI001FE0285D|nr:MULTISPECIES: glycosyl hydrolase 108 family protein [unclassified Mesorhizobium]
MNEGACSHHPADPGGATVKGITQRICNAHLCCPPALPTGAARASAPSRDNLVRANQIGGYLD